MVGIMQALNTTVQHHSFTPPLVSENDEKKEPWGGWGFYFAIFRSTGYVTTYLVV